MVFRQIIERSIAIAILTCASLARLSAPVCMGMEVDSGSLTRLGMLTLSLAVEHSSILNSNQLHHYGQNSK